MPSSERKPSNSESKSASSSRADRSETKPATAGRESKRDATDAVALLKADHERVAAWFAEYERSDSPDSKQELAQRICAALTVHSTIEEEIFYPAFLEATGETDLHHEAEVEHQGAKVLIAEIEASGPEDEYFDSKVTVLAQLIRHHVGEEEQRDGMFAKARASEMDLKSLGRELQARKDEIDKPAARRAG